ncbi:unnamed protein product [Closterium sp. NIES-54]
MSQVSAKFTRKSSSSSESANLLTPDLVDGQLSSDEANADEPGAVRNLPLDPEVDPLIDTGSADGQLPVTLSPALAADEVDENDEACEHNDDSGDDDYSFARCRKVSVAVMHAGASDPTSKRKGKRQKKPEAVLYFIAEAPRKEINFWPEPQELRQQLIRTYWLVNVSEETFNLVMNSHPERERILKDKVGERWGNLFTQVKTWAHGPGGFVRESKIPMLAAENMAPVQRRNFQQ